MGKGGGGDGGAEQARADEMARQMKITEGTQRINNIFDGGPTQKADWNALNVGQQYFKGDGTTWTPDEGDLAHVTKEKEEGKDGPVTILYEGAGGEGQFTDGFFNDRATAYSTYAGPQLEQQLEDAKRQLVFSLDRKGTLNSSIRAQKEAELEGIFQQQKREIADTGQAYANTARSNVESSRADLINTLNATGDVDGTVNQAISNTQTLSQPDKFDPIGQLFAGFTSGLGNNFAAEKAALMASNSGSGQSVGLYGDRSNNSVSVR